MQLGLGDERFYFKEEMESFYLFIFVNQLVCKNLYIREIGIAHLIAKVHFYHLAIFNDSLTKDNNV